MSHVSPPAPPLVARLDLLVKSLLDGSLVPFLGAGVSATTGILVRSYDEPEAHLRRAFSPKTKLLGIRLKRRLKSRGKEQAGLGSASFWKLVRDARKVDLAQLSELLHLLDGPYALCECLQIQLFTELEPLPAHVYLACLAREGLVRQVITTNYDTCLETAFTRTLGTLFLLYLLFGDLSAVAPGAVPMPGHALPGGTGSDATLIPWWRWIRVEPGSPGLSLVVPDLRADQASRLFNDALGQQVRTRQAPGLILHLVSEQAPERQQFSSAERSMVYQIAIPSLEPARSAFGGRVPPLPCRGRQQGDFAGVPSTRRMRHLAAARCL